MQMWSEQFPDAGLAHELDRSHFGGRCNSGGAGSLNGEEDALGSAGRIQLDDPRAERRDGIADGFAHREGQHQRRLAHRLAAAHHPGSAARVRKST